MNEETASQKTATPVQSHYDVLEQALVRRVNDQVDRVESELDLLKQVIADLVTRRPSGERRPAEATTSLTDYARQLVGRVPVQPQPVDPIASTTSGDLQAADADRAESYRLPEPEPVTCVEVADHDMSDEGDYIDVESESLAEPGDPRALESPGTEASALLSLSAETQLPPACEEWVDTVKSSAPTHDDAPSSPSEPGLDDNVLPPPQSAVSLAALEAPTGDALNLAPPSLDADEWFSVDEPAAVVDGRTCASDDPAVPLVDPQAILVTEPADVDRSADRTRDEAAEYPQDLGPDLTPQQAAASGQVADTDETDAARDRQDDNVDNEGEPAATVTNHLGCEGDSGPDGLTPCSQHKVVAPSSAQCAWAAEVGAAVMRVANQSRSIPDSYSDPAEPIAINESGDQSQTPETPEVKADLAPNDKADSAVPLASAESESGQIDELVSQDDGPAQQESSADRSDSTAEGATDSSHHAVTDALVSDVKSEDSADESSSNTSPVLLSGASSAKALEATTEVLTGKNEGVFGHKTAHTLVPVEKPLASDATPGDRWSHRLEHSWRASGFRCTIDCASRAETRAAGLQAVALAYRSGLKVVVVAATQDWQRWWVDEIVDRLPGAHVQICDGNPHVLSSADVTVLSADDKILSQVCSNSGLDVCLVAQDVYDYGADAQQDVLTAPTSWRLALVHGPSHTSDVLGRAVQRYFGDDCVATDSDLVAAAELARPFTVFRASVELPSWEAQEYASLQLQMTRSRERLYRMGADPDHSGNFASTLHHWLVGHGGEQAQSRAEEYVTARNACSRCTADSTVKVEALLQQADLFAAQGKTLVYSDKLRPSERVAAAVNNAGGSARALPASRFGFLSDEVDVAVLLSPGVTTRDFFRRIAAVREPSHTTAPAQVVIVHLAQTHEQDGIEDQGWGELLRCAADVHEGLLVDLAEWLEG